MLLYSTLKVGQSHAVTREFDVFVSWFTMLHLTDGKTTSFPLISQFCDPHGNGHTLPQKLTTRLVFASSEKGGRQGEEGGNGGRWHLKNQGKQRCDSDQIIGQSSHNVSNSRLTSTALI